MYHCKYLTIGKAGLRKMGASSARHGGNHAQESSIAAGTEAERAGEEMVERFDVRSSACGTGMIRRARGLEISFVRKKRQKVAFQDLALLPPV
jgi:hypothetical protein